MSSCVPPTPQATQESRWKLPKELRKKTTSDGDAVGADGDPPSSASRAAEDAPKSKAAVAKAVEAFAAAGAKQTHKKSELFERLQASLAGRINPMAALGGGPPPMIRIPREEQLAGVSQSDFHQQQQQEEELEAETAHMTAAERLRFLRKKRQESMFAKEKIEQEDDFMQEFARNMEKKVGQQQQPPDARANFDWRKKRAEEQAAREKEKEERDAALEREREKEKQAQEALERQRLQEREEQKRREEEEETRRRQEEAKAQEEEAKQKQARADEEKRRKESQEEEARERAGVTAAAAANTRDDEVNEGVREPETLSGDKELLSRDSDALNADTSGDVTVETADASGDAGDYDSALQPAGVEGGGNAEEADAEEEERRRLKEERRARRRAAMLEAARAQQEPSISPVKTKKSRAKSTEREDHEQQEAQQPPSQPHQHHHHQHRHQHQQHPPLPGAPPFAYASSPHSMGTEGGMCTCCRPHPQVPMHYPPPPPPPFPMYYPYAPPPPPPPVMMMVMPPYAPPPPPPVLYPPPPQQLPGMLPTAIVPFANSQVALYGGGAMGVRPVVDRCDGCQGRGVGLVEKNGFCNHCNRLRLDFIVVSTRIRQRCSVCGGWGLDLVQAATGKCDHCSRAGHKPLTGAVATSLAASMLAQQQQSSRSASNGAAKPANGFREQRAESIEWDDDDEDSSNDDGSDWDE